MEWIFDKKQKTVAENASLVVKNLHSIMEKQKSQLQEFENLFGECIKIIIPN